MANNIDDIMVDVKSQAQKEIATSEESTKALKDLFSVLSQESQEYLASLGVTSSSLRENVENAKQLLAILEKLPQIQYAVAGIQKTANKDQQSSLDILKQSLTLTNQLLAAQEKLTSAQKRRLNEVQTSLQAIQLLEQEGAKKLERAQEEVHKKHMDNIRKQQTETEKMIKKYQELTSFSGWFGAAFGGRGTGIGSLMGNVNQRDLLSVIAGRYSPFAPANRAVGGVGGNETEVQMRRALESASTLNQIVEATEDTSINAEKEARSTETQAKEMKSPGVMKLLGAPVALAAAGALGTMGMLKTTADTISSMRTPEGFLKGLGAPIGMALNKISPTAGALFNSVVGIIADALMAEVYMWRESSIHTQAALVQSGQANRAKAYRFADLSPWLAGEETAHIFETFPRLGVNLANDAGELVGARVRALAGLERMYGEAEVQGIIPSILAGRSGNNFSKIVTEIQRTFAVAKRSAQDFGLSVSQVVKWLAEAAEQARFLNIDSKYVNQTWLNMYQIRKQLATAGINLRTEGKDILTTLTRAGADMPFDRRAWLGSEILERYYGVKNPDIFRAAYTLEMGKAAVDAMKVVRTKEGLVGVKFSEKVEPGKINADVVKLFLEKVNTMTKGAKNPAEIIAYAEHFGKTLSDKFTPHVVRTMLAMAAEGVSLEKISEKATSISKERDPVALLNELVSKAQLQYDVQMAISDLILGILNSVVIIPAYLRAWWKGGDAFQLAEAMYSKYVTGKMSSFVERIGRVGGAVWDVLVPAHILNDVVDDKISAREGARRMKINTKEMKEAKDRQMLKDLLITIGASTIPGVGFVVGARKIGQYVKEWRDAKEAEKKEQLKKDINKRKQGVEQKHSFLDQGSFLRNATIILRVDGKDIKTVIERVDADRLA